MIQDAKVLSTATVVAGRSYESDRYRIKVHSLHACNDTVSDEVIQLYLVKKGESVTGGADGNKIVPDFSIPTKSAAIIDIPTIFLEGGETLQMVGTTGSLVNTVATVEVV